MDTFVRQTLLDWKLSDFIARFRKSGVDKEVFLLIDDEFADKLFEKHEFGFKFKFLRRLNQLRASNSLSASTPSLSQKDISNSKFLFDTDEQETINIFPVAQDPLNLDSRSSIAEIVEIEDLTSSLCMSQPVTAKRTQSIQELINSTTDGKLAYLTYLKDQSINTRLLSDLIIKHEFDTTGQYRIKSERLEEIALELASIFKSPLLSIEDTAKLFFCPYQNGKLGCNVAASGVLHDKYHNLRKVLKTVGLIAKKEVLPEDFIPNDTFVDWLKENDEPREEVIEKWTSSYGDRNPCTKVNDYFYTYKCLRSDFGHVLLAVDYDKVHGCTSKNLLDNWDTIASKIIKVLEYRKKSQPSDQNFIKSRKVPVLAFLALPRLLGTILRKPGVEDRTKDLTNSFLLFIESHLELEKLEEKRRLEQLKKKNDCNGPYVAVVGNFISDDNIEENCDVLLIIQEQKYQIESKNIVHAIDYCYKAIFALNIKFPRDCAHIWQFLQTYVYKNSCKVKHYIAVQKLISDIDNVKLI